MDTRVEGLVAKARSGDLTRRQVVERAAALGVSAAAVLALVDEPSVAEARGHRVRPKKWQRGRGWGWVWGRDDELGALNELSPELARKALARARRGRVYDLGLEYDRRSYKFAGHASGEITTYRSPQGLLLQRDQPDVIDPVSNSLRTTYASCLNTISDNVATQIDGLGHIYEGDPPHAYNGFRGERSGRRLRPPQARRDDHPTGGRARHADRRRRLPRPPDPARALRDRPRPPACRAAAAGGGHRPARCRPDPHGHRRRVAARRRRRSQQGGGRSGRLRRDHRVGGPVARRAEGRADDRIRHERRRGHPAAEQLPDGTSFNPVHVYLLVRQGVHIVEFNNLEDLARDQVYKLGYALSPNKIRGNVAGTVQRPVGLA